MNNLPGVSQLKTGEVSSGLWLPCSGLVCFDTSLILHFLGPTVSLSIMSNSYKALKEEFVSNLSGGSISEVNIVTSVAPVCTLLACI